MERVTDIKLRLQQCAESSPKSPEIFYKTGPGQYAEHDRFMGVSVPMIRKIAGAFQDLSQKELQILMASSFNEERFLALVILVHQYQKVDPCAQEEIYQFYKNNLKYVNNWNLVDASAHLIMGAHLFKKERKPLLRLADSDVLWERRVAIVTTWYFIRNNDLDWTFKIAEILLNDAHDLMHKAVGWMLREAGKKDQKQLVMFLERYAPRMPRTMLRYAIEKFPEPQRKFYLNQGKTS